MANPSQSPFLAHLQSILASTSSAVNDDNALAEVQQLLAGKTAVRTLTDDDVAQELSQLVQNAKRKHPKSANLTNGRSKASDDSDALSWLKALSQTTENYDRLTTLLAASTRSDDEISSDILDILGFDAVDSIPDLLSKRERIRHEYEVQHTNRAVEHIAENGKDGGSGVNAPVDSDAEGAYASLQTPRRLGKQRGKGNRQHRDATNGMRPGMSIDELEQMHLRNLEEAANRPLVNPNNRAIVGDEVRYPHVYATKSAMAGSAMSGGKALLPLGSTRVEHEHYSEVTIPTLAKHPSSYTATLLATKQLPPLVRQSLPYDTLNRLQSIVYPTAYETSENMLVCAPTGAGKTDVAVLTVLRALSMYADIDLKSGKMRNKNFKVVYVAPMKALASEIVVKMSKRFSWCGLAVRELTGDMQLTRKEISETQMIVTTPEKWDVVTRKTTGEGELASLLKLLIVDEVHLLAEDRGAVLESIIARTLRQVESSQSLIRIVGLSATLPNFVDVADFLRVNPYVGLFFFDSSFRPVPLEQHFIASKGKPGSQQSRDNLDIATFDKTLDLIKEGHQVLIFVHARKDTVKTAQMLRERAIEESETSYFDVSDNPSLEAFKREIAMSRNRELKDLVSAGIGIHHAGMLRSDRNLSERLFERNVTNILVCTATLAWGVNLPAYAVIIKGTQLYDSSKGQFMDLSVLDVLQMFGRAGRPQYETHGVSYICTTSDKADHYITAVNQQVPIESKFVNGLVDSLNAEIALGTVTTVDEGVRWLGYTFLQVRMRKNPLVYGLSSLDVSSDPMLGQRRRDLVLNAVKALTRNGMVQHDEATEGLSSSEIGQIASKYYVRSASIEKFNELLRPKMTEADLLAVLAKSTEFDQVAIRDSETDELKRLIENVIPCQVKGGTDTSDGKANVLLQAFICQAQLEDFALISDMGYVAQNAGRIARALQEIVMSRKWSQATASLLSICKAVEKRMWPWVHPLQQLSLPSEVVYNINRWIEAMSIEEIIQSTAMDLGSLIHMNERFGDMVHTAARRLPRLSVQSRIKTLTHDLLRISLVVQPDFEWSEKIHGRVQFFYIWVSDGNDHDIHQYSRFAVRSEATEIDIEFSIPAFTLPRQLHIRLSSETWFGCDQTMTIDTSKLHLPRTAPPKITLSHLPYTPDHIHADLAEFYGIHRNLLSPFEIRSLHSIFFSNSNLLVSAPISTARHELLCLCIWRVIKTQATSRCLVMTANATLARALRHRLNARLRSWEAHYNVLIETRGAKHAPMPRSGHTITIATPSYETSQDYDLIVADDLQSLSAEYELALSHITQNGGEDVRIVAFSSCLVDGRDVAVWLNVQDEHMLSFPPSSRPMPLVNRTVSFGQPHSPSLMKAMIKPAYDAIRNQSDSAICFVSHRAQCYRTLTDFTAHSALDLNGFINIDADTLLLYAERVTDQQLAEGIQHGFAIYHDGMHPTDQGISLHLFASGALKVLIAPREACYTLPHASPLVIVMGTQMAEVRPGSSESKIVDYGMQDILQMQSLAQGKASEDSATFMVFTQNDKATLLSKFLAEGLPIESTLLESDIFMRLILRNITTGRIHNQQSCLDAFANTFFSHQVVNNPSLYDCHPQSRSALLSHLVDRFMETAKHHCLVQTRDRLRLVTTPFGKQVAESRVTQKQVKQLFTCSIEKAEKLVQGYKMPAIAPEILDECLAGLAKSIQRRIRLTPEVDLEPARMLMVMLLARKIPRNSTLADMQATLAMHAILHM